VPIARLAAAQAALSDAKGTAKRKQPRKNNKGHGPNKVLPKRIKNIALLTAEQEVSLAKRIQKGDKKAREDMIRANLRLVISIAKRYTNLGIALSDLIEEGNIGLMRGVDKFDWQKGFRFQPMRPGGSSRVYPVRSSTRVK